MTGIGLHETRRGLEAAMENLNSLKQSDFLGKTVDWLVIYFYSIKGAIYALLISNLVLFLITYMKTISTLRTKNYI